MKRRFKSDHGHPPNVQSSTSGGFARVWDSDYRYDKSKTKRVRFTDVDRDPLSNNISDDSSTGYEATWNPRSGIPKTSEYAFFKKVKEAVMQRNRRFLNKESEQKLRDIGHCHPNILHKEKEKLKKPNTNDYIGNVKLSFRLEKVSLNNQCVFVSPVEGRSKSPGEACPVSPKSWSFSHPKNVTTLDQNLQLSPQTAPSKYSGSQYLKSDVFSAKRLKLRQWAETNLAGTENFSSKGYDMVTVLLSRLSPGSNENKGSKFTGNTGCSPVFPESDPSETRHHQSYRGDLTEPEYGTCQNSELSCVDWPDFASDNCFTKCNAKTVSHNEMVDNNHGSKSETTKSLLKQLDSPVHLLFGRSGFTDWYYRKELDGFYCPNESPRREPQTLFLDWDFNKEKDEPEITITANSCEDKMHSQIVTLWDADLQKSIDTRHNTIALCSSSLFSDHSPHFCMLPYFHSTGFQKELYSANFHTRDFGRNLEYEEYAVAEPDNLSSLYDAENLDPEEYGDRGNAISDCLDCPQDSPVHVFSEKGNLDSDAFLLPMALNNSEWNSLPATGFHLPNHSTQHACRSAYTIQTDKTWNSLPATGFHLPNHSTQHACRSAYTIQTDKAWNLGSSNSKVITSQEEAFDCNFQSSFDRMLSCPLLLKDSSWDRSEEIYLGCSDEWKRS